MVNKELVETGLEIAGGLIDGAVGNGIEAGVDGYKSYEDKKKRRKTKKRKYLGLIRF